MELSNTMYVNLLDNVPEVISEGLYNSNVLLGGPTPRPLSILHRPPPKPSTFHFCPFLTIFLSETLISINHLSHMAMSIVLP